MDFLGAIFVALLAFYQIYVQNTGAATTGFSLNMAVGFCGMIFYLIRVYNTFEVESNRYALSFQLVYSAKADGYE